LDTQTQANTDRPVFRGVMGLKPLEKSTQKFMGLPYCGNIEHEQLKNFTVK